METPVLTKSQKGKSLSAKQKKKPSVNIRNVLATVVRNNSCPIISEEESLLFREKLLELYPCEPQIRLKWRALKAIPKEKRKEFRNGLQKNIEKPNYSDRFIVGINAVTRAVENAKVSLVLVANDVNPQLLIKHVIEVCHVQEIPVIQVPKLRNIVKESFNFPAIVVAFKICSESNPLDTIKQLFHSHISKSAAISNKKKSVIEANQLLSDLDEQVAPPVKETFSTSENNVYLTRNSTQRVFVPCSPVTVHQQETDLNYIKLDDFGEKEPVTDPEPSHDYKKLKVKRVKPNPKRIKKKNKKIKIK